MTDATSAPPSEDDVALAGEYVLRLLDREQSEAVRRRMNSDPAFLELVRSWDTQLAPIAEDIEPVAPDPGLRKAIMEQLFEEVPPERHGWSFRLWPVLLAAAAVSVLALFLVAPWQTGPAPSVYAADLAAQDGSLVVNARYDLSTKDVAITLASGEIPAGRDLQIWGIFEGGDPVPIGLVPASGTARFDVPEPLRGKVARMICAVSLEPAGGSPTGQPTGPILASSPLTLL